MNETLLRDNIKKPSKPHRVVNQNEIPTREDIKLRQEQIEKMKALGIKVNVLDSKKEFEEDIDKLEASLLIMQGKEIPKELEERLLRKKKEDNSKLKN